MKADRLDLRRYRDTIAVADGGWSTQLRARGLPPRVLPETANLTHAALVASLAREYLAAGACFLTTNTFAANRYVFKQRGVKHDPLEVARAGAKIARKAVGDSGALVVGSIGPSGKLLAVREASEEQLSAVFAEQAGALAEGGVDAIVLETFSELAEIVLAIRAVKSAVPLLVIASLSFDSGPQHTRTIMGAEAGECAAAVQDAGADAAGCNCGAGIDTVLPAVVALRANCELPLWVKPSAGVPELVEGELVYPVTPEQFDDYVPALLEAGANIIGGCCGVGPEHIRRVAALVAARLRKPPRKR